MLNSTQPCGPCQLACARGELVDERRGLYAEIHELQARIDGMRAGTEGSCVAHDSAGAEEQSATRLQRVCAPANHERFEDACGKLTQVIMQAKALDEVHGALEWSLTRRYPTAGSSGYVSKRSSTKHKMHQDSPRRFSLLQYLSLIHI